MTGHGGARKGAGRKKLPAKEKKITKSIVITPSFLEKIKKKYPDKSLSQIVEMALLKLFE